MQRAMSIAIEQNATTAIKCADVGVYKTIALGGHTVNRFLFPPHN